MRAIQKDEEARKKKDQIRGNQSVFWTNKTEIKSRNQSNQRNTRPDSHNTRATHETITPRCSNCLKPNHRTEDCWYINKPKCSMCHKHSHPPNKCQYNPKNKNRNERAHTTTSNPNQDLFTNLFKENGYTRTTEEETEQNNKELAYNVEDNIWIVNSRAMSHMCHNSSLFTKLETSRNGVVTVANKQQINIKGEGIVQLITKDSNSQEIKLNLQNTLHARTRKEPTVHKPINEIRTHHYL